MIERIQGIAGALHVQKVKNAYRSFSAGEGSGDGVQVSAFSKVLSRATAEAEKLPDVRTAKVEEIRRQVHEGSYALKLGAVAAGLVAAGILQDEV